jgi:putative transposase
MREQSPGYYHVTTRGNDGANIYVDDDDRNVFLGLLHRVAIESPWTLRAWCLMTNHFHLVVEIRPTISRPECIV